MSNFYLPEAPLWFHSLGVLKTDPPAQTCSQDVAIVLVGMAFQ
jgi:hypothetical protein